jgi:hypothetical protein
MLCVNYEEVKIKIEKPFTLSYEEKDIAWSDVKLRTRSNQYMYLHVLVGET